MQWHTSEALLNASRWFADLRLPSPYDQPESLPPHYWIWNHLPLWKRNWYLWRPFFQCKKIQQNATKQPNPWLDTFCHCWNWSTCRSHFQQMRCTHRTCKTCTTQSNIQSCRYINQFDTYICRPSHYTILAIGYWCNDHSSSSYHWWWWSIYLCGFCYKSSPAVWEKKVWWP